MRVFKYPIKIEDEQTVKLPEGAEIIYVGLDPGGTPCLWAIVNERSVRVNRTIYVAGTGHPLPKEKIRHLGSILQHPFVWHVFEPLPT
jgi:hypothetical protein